MIIIVEGIDRVGKTTLCNRLSEEFKIPIYRHIGERKFNEIKNDNETEKNLQILEICKLSNSFIIFDRFHISDYIYGVLERNYDIQNASKNLQITEEFINKVCKDAILLLVLPTNIEESSKQHGKNLSNYDRLFYEVFKESKIKNKYRCTYNTIGEAVTYVRSIISKEA